MEAKAVSDSNHWFDGRSSRSIIAFVVLQLPSVIVFAILLIAEVPRMRGLVFTDDGFPAYTYFVLDVAERWSISIVAALSLIALNTVIFRRTRVVLGELASWCWCGLSLVLEWCFVSLYIYLMYLSLFEAMRLWKMNLPR
jgi:hypothetical protein